MENEMDYTLQTPKGKEPIKGKAESSTHRIEILQSVQQVTTEEEVQ